ncbi:hypothetical protein X737_37660 [Mesorhizobium sp. L48C026A00]|nr:hypothetical protein X737_37660 [Mesorhizobium sp. L48C026A00]
MQSLEASISNDLTHDRAILLLDKCLVILPVGAATGEFDIITQAIPLNALVHEDAVLVGVEAQQRERQQLAQFGQRSDQDRLLANQQRRAFRPARGDIGQHQGLREGALRVWAGMRNKTRLDSAGSSQSEKVRTGTLRRIVVDPFRRRGPLALAFNVLENAINRRWAHRQQLPAGLAIHSAVSVAFHRFDQAWQERV